MRISYNTIKEIIENQIKIYEHPFNIEKIFPASFIAQELKNILLDIDRAEQIELENEYNVQVQNKDVFFNIISRENGKIQYYKREFYTGNIVAISQEEYEQGVKQ